MKHILYITIALLCFTACKKEVETIKEVTVDNIIYDLGNTVVYQSSSEKTKQKTDQQYLSVLYADIFQTAIPQDDLSQVSDIRLAFGDKQAADELIINSWINAPDAVIPTNTQMRNDLENFIRDTYIRFYLREPTPYESIFLKHQIENDTNLTPEMIYTSFATSNEYKYY